MCFDMSVAKTWNKVREIHDVCSEKPKVILYYHVNDHLPQGLSLLLAQVDKNITVLVLNQLERHSQMVIFQNGLIVVHQGKLRTWKSDRAHSVYRCP